MGRPQSKESERRGGRRLGVARLQKDARTSAALHLCSIGIKAALQHRSTAAVQPCSIERSVGASLRRGAFSVHASGAQTVCRKRSPVCRLQLAQPARPTSRALTSQCVFAAPLRSFRPLSPTRRPLDFVGRPEKCVCCEAARGERAQPALPPSQRAYLFFAHSSSGEGKIASQKLPHTPSGRQRAHACALELPRERQSASQRTAFGGPPIGGRSENTFWQDSLSHTNYSHTVTHTQTDSLTLEQ